MIVINNGFNKCHLASAAAELSRRDMLSAFSTGAFPSRYLQKWLEVFGLVSNRKLARLLARLEPVPEQLVFSDWVSEALHVVATGLRGRRLTRLVGDLANERSMRWCGWRAQKAVRYAIRNGAKLYHYRAGFGHASVRLAKRNGLFALCDHSIAHPAMLEQLVADSGKWPAEARKSAPSERVWQDIQRDIEQADAVLVNSEFVKETFLRQGWKADRVHVIYLGVDDAFVDGIVGTLSPQVDDESRVRIAFAGGFEVRKGARVLTSAIERLVAHQGQEFELHMAGTIAQDVQREFAKLRRYPNVYHHGLLSRKELASLLASADVFVFPSLAEGSARVVFEALACGCYVITTPNSGSIVEDGTHGRLVPAGDPEALAVAVREACTLGRKTLRQVGEFNARVVREHYRQSQYGDKLVALYSELLGTDVLSVRNGSVPATDVSVAHTGSSRPPTQRISDSAIPGSQ